MVTLCPASATVHLTPAFVAFWIARVTSLEIIGRICSSVGCNHGRAPMRRVPNSSHLAYLISEPTSALRPDARTTIEPTRKPVSIFGDSPDADAWCGFCRVGSGGKRSDLPTRIELQIVVESQNGYPDTRNRDLSGECRIIAPESLEDEEGGV